MTNVHHAHNTTGFLAYIQAARETMCKKPTEKLVLLYHASNVNINGTYFKTYAEMSAETSLPISQLEYWNNQFKERGILSWTTGSGIHAKANTYRLNLKALRKYAEDRKAFMVNRTKEAKANAAERSKRYRNRKTQTEMVPVTV